MNRCLRVHVPLPVFISLLTEEDCAGAFQSTQLSNEESQAQNRALRQNGKHGSLMYYNLRNRKHINEKKKKKRADLTQSEVPHNRIEINRKDALYTAKKKKVTHIHRKGREKRL